MMRNLGRFGAFLGIEVCLHRKCCVPRVSANNMFMKALLKPKLVRKRVTSPSADGMAIADGEAEIHPGSGQH